MEKYRLLKERIPEKGTRLVRARKILARRPAAEQDFLQRRKPMTARRLPKVRKLVAPGQRRLSYQPRTETALREAAQISDQDFRDFQIMLRRDNLALSRLLAGKVSSAGNFDPPAVRETE